MSHFFIVISTFSLGWAATPAVQSSMPDFYEKLGDKWRSVEQV